VLKSFKESELKILPSGDFELLGMHCKSCGEVMFGLHPLCLNCSSPDCEQVTLDKQGRIRNFTILHVPPHQDWKGPVPYVIAEIEFSGGAVTTTQIVDTDPANAKIKVGMPVHIEIREADKTEEGDSIMIYVAKLLS
jgi:uncharacterized OB-fold protein